MNRLVSYMVLLLCLGLGAAAAHAIELGDAKQQGLVGEQLNGYLGIVAANAPSDVRALVNEVNAARKQKYQEIAEQNGTSLETVEALAGQKAIEKTQAGHYIQSATGWKKK